jgi:hypothetical protein
MLPARERACAAAAGAAAAGACPAVESPEGSSVMRTHEGTRPAAAAAAVIASARLAAATATAAPGAAGSWRDADDAGRPRSTSSPGPRSGEYDSGACGRSTSGRARVWAGAPASSCATAASQLPALLARPSEAADAVSDAARLLARDWSARRLARSAAAASLHCRLSRAEARAEPRPPAGLLPPRAGSASVGAVGCCQPQRVASPKASEAKTASWTLPPALARAAAGAA